MRSQWQALWLVPLRQTMPASTIDDLLAEGRALPELEAVDLALAEAQLASDGASTRTTSIRATSVQLLTPRQSEVAALVAQGLTNRQIAERLIVTERAIAAHVENILDKLGVSSRTQIAVWASEQGLLAKVDD